MPDRVPVLLDTDIGTNIDDALALLYLLRQPRCDLLGITTVSGQPDVRARLADAICRTESRSDVPIVAGADRSLTGASIQPDVAQADCLRRWSHRAELQADGATEFICQTIRRRPRAVTLLAVGPLTNVARAFKEDPELPLLIGRFVMMGGVYRSEPGMAATETNTRLDPAATRAVFRAEPSGHTCVGFDVTKRCTLDRDRVRQSRAYCDSAILADLADMWFESRDSVTYHDPLAAALLFDSNVAVTERGRVRITDAKTAFRFETDPTGPHHVAVDVDTGRFFVHYHAVVAR